MGPGPSCSENLDCPGTNPSGMGLIECASGICGGTGAACTADDGGVEGVSSLCASGEWVKANPPVLCLGLKPSRIQIPFRAGQCKTSKCAAPQVSPVPRKRRDQQVAAVIKEDAPIWHACPPGRTACPAGGQNTGYEVSFARGYERCNTVCRRSMPESRSVSIPPPTLKVVEVALDRLSLAKTAPRSTW